ncbi:MAG: aldo/keto reductase [Candidatus Krumholzibacteriota bacterium]|nr:aldo/keto reductase [Candidatus Krumholzibacteriota bacterium]
MEKKELKTGRRDFIRVGIAGIAGAALAPALLGAQEEKKENKKKKLVYRTLGRTGIKVPIVSIGAQAQDAAIFSAALDAGLTHFDTANTYGNGEHEKVVGEVIKGRPRDSYMISTKVYLPIDQKTGSFKKEATTEAFIETFEGSLERLGVDYVEVLHAHALASREAVLYEPVLKAFEKLKKDGRILASGVSVHTNEVEVIDAMIESGSYDVVLTAYNFRQPHWKEVKKAIARAAKKGIGVVAMKTQAGVYWDKERTKMINMKAALKWVLSDENVHTSIPGFTTFEQLEEDISVMADLKMSAQEKKDLELGSAAGYQGLYCDQCGRCIDQCRNHIDIPSMMRSYMYAYGYRNLSKAKETIRPVLKESGLCGGCASCSVDCRMGFDVKGKISDIARLGDVPDDFLA